MESPTKCVVCGRALSHEAAARYAVQAHSQILATCGPEHQRQARANSGQYLSQQDSCC